MDEYRPDLFMKLLNAKNRNPRFDVQREDLKVIFEVGDEVYFIDKLYKKRTGTILRMNPKRAVVKINSEYWDVNYFWLQHSCRSKFDDRAKRVDMLIEVVEETLQLLDEHGLKKWKMGFSSSRSALGMCNFKLEKIIISVFHIVKAKPEEVKDTIRHEVAHAIVGQEDGHGSKWREKAVELGAIPKATFYSQGLEQKEIEQIKNRFAIGQMVSFDFRGEKKYGKIKSKNPKTVSVFAYNGTYRVPYSKIH